MCAGLALLAILLGQALGATPSPVTVETLSHGRFHDFPLYAPPGRTHGFALLLSDQGGWNPAADAVARRLAADGTLVAGIDAPTLVKALAADGGDCLYPGGDLENLSHFAQAYRHVPTYLTPRLVGIGSGSALAYAILAQAPKSTFGGALGLDFCPRLALAKPLCKGGELSFRAAGKGAMQLLPAAALGNPWIVVQAGGSAACPLERTRAFVAAVGGAEFLASAAAGSDLPAAFARLLAKGPAERLPPPPAELGDLPVVVVPAAAGAATRDSLAIMLSGDGGWAGLDQSVAGALADAGIPVVGLDSLRYFWTARTPAGLAADTDRMIRYYLAKLGKQKVLLIGYSQGADVLPFAVNRLPPATRASVSLVAVMGLSEHALFEFHVSSWLHDDDSGPATLPEVDRIAGPPVLCLFGADESDSLCPQLDPKRVRLVKMSGGHHFDGDYVGLARQILAAAAESAPPRP
jgi:type IV secretory pathway VirJ component